MEPYIISALSALLGALIPTVANVVLQLRQPLMNRKEELFKVQTDVIDVYLEALQSVSNAVKSDDKHRKHAFEDLFRATNKAALYVDSTTAEKIIKYRDRVIFGNLNEDEHAESQNEIINSMRKTIGLEGIQGFKVIGNRLPDG